MNDETIEEINRKDARLRFIVIIVTVMTTLALSILLVLAYQGSLSNQRLINSQNKTLSTLVSVSKQRTSQINDLQHHIDCIVELFKIQNRANLVISDIENCKIDQVGGTNAVVKSTPVVPHIIATKPLALSTPSPTRTAIKPQSIASSKSFFAPLVLALSKICIPFTKLCL